MDYLYSGIQMVNYLSRGKPNTLVLISCYEPEKISHTAQQRQVGYIDKIMKNLSQLYGQSYCDDISKLLIRPDLILVGWNISSSYRYWNY